MLNEKAKHEVNPVTSGDEPHLEDEELVPEETGTGTWREALVAAFQKVRRQQKPAESRHELGRDKTKSLLLVAGVCAGVLPLFFGIFSHPKKRNPLPGEITHIQPDLGRRVTPGQENNDPTKVVTPMLSADVRSTNPGSDGQLTPEDIDRTSRTVVAQTTPASTPSKAASPQDYSLNKVDFSDPTGGLSTTTSNIAVTARSDFSADLKKPSLVFVRSTQAKLTMKPNVPEEAEEQLPLAVGARLVARLQTPVSSAVPTPVVAVIEYNYELSGQIVLPAGAKVIGRLTQANPSGYVAIQFNRIEMPDGKSEKIDASAMSLNFGPLKGNVSGKKTGTKFLVRSLTGLGTIASYTVGSQGTSSGELISPNTLMRERLADNIATAGQEELNGLAFNQNPVVTLPGNTRFYIVVQKSSSDVIATTPNSHDVGIRTAGTPDSVPTLEELRQLIQLRNEINDLYIQAKTTATTEPQPQQ